MNSNRRTFLKLGTLGAAVAALQGLGFACGGDEERTADDAASGAASQWFELLYDVVKAERTSPPVAARTYGITAVALYESVVPGARKRRSLAGQLNDLPALPRPSGRDLNWQAVANAAVARTVLGLYPSLSQPSLDAVKGLEQRLAAETAAMDSTGMDERSVEYGRSVADAILAWAARDGFAASRGAAYKPAGKPGEWTPTPPQFAATPLEPAWGELRPMVLRSGNELRPEGHPPFQTGQGTAFYQAALEVYNVGRGLTQEQKAIADYWSDGAGATGTPPGHWIAIVSQIARKDGLSLAAAAEAYARVGIAVHDAFICCWNAKYVFNLLRPVTYINQNIDPAWSPHIPTPPFPAYTSGHSSQSGAAALVLGDMFGDKSFQDTTHVDHGLQPAQPPRSFASFEEAAAEAAISRLYGGIHYTFDNKDGLDSGKLIGQTILQRVRFST